MDPVSRRFNEPVSCLPGNRSSVYDRHHLFWPGADIRLLGLSDFRGVGCTSARKLDSLVHSVLHQRFSGVLGLGADGISDLRHRAAGCLERHFDYRCACRKPSRLCAVDALSLEACEPKRFDGPPCTALLVDGQVYELMRDYYEAVAPITDAVRGGLAARCDAGDCSCVARQGALRSRQPSLWDQYRQAAG